MTGASVRWEGTLTPVTGRQMVYSNSFPEREWEWENEISVTSTVYCQGRALQSVKFVAWQPLPLTKQ